MECEHETWNANTEHGTRTRNMERKHGTKVKTALSKQFGRTVLKVRLGLSLFKFTAIIHPARGIENIFGFNSI